MNAVTYCYNKIRSVPVTICLASLACLFFVLPAASDAFAFNFQQPLHLYRVLCCNLLHWSGEHLLWDIAMFFGLGVIAERVIPVPYYVTLLISGIAIPFSIALLQPEVESYRGLSGLDTAMFCLLATTMFGKCYRNYDWLSTAMYALCLIAFVVKLCYEFYFRTTLFVSEPNFTPLPLAHLIGAACGVIVVCGSVLVKSILTYMHYFKPAFFRSF